MKRLCLDCGLIFETEEKKRLFKKKDLGVIPKCDYCRGQKSIDITDAEDIAPFIFKMTEIGYNVTGHAIERNAEDGKFSFSIMVTDTTGNSYKDLNQIFDTYGMGMKHCFFHTIDESDTTNYVLGASISYDGSFIGHIGSKYDKSMNFTSYDFVIAYAEMVKEFDAILERVMSL